MQEHSWRPDTPEQFVVMLAADNPSPINSLMVRAYEFTNDVGRLAQAMAVARRETKPLFVGQFGVPGSDTPEARARCWQLEAIQQANQELRRQRATSNP